VHSNAPDIKERLWEKRKDNLSRIWYKFSGNYLSIVGLAIVFIVIFMAIFAPWVTPYPEHRGAFVDFSNAMQSPNVEHWFGTDAVGRDILTRVIFGFRFSLMMGFVVIGLAAPPGIVAGLVAGYFRDTWVDTVIMRITDVFLAVPPLILAMAITAVLPPNVFYAMLAVTLMWWPWYARLVYGIASSLQNEFFVQAAQVTGASKIYIIFREILPNSISAIFTKMTLDVGIVIIIAASLSFVGLGAQPPTPDLGTMVSDGAKYLPDQWWVTICPALAIVFIVLGFNLLGDGLRDMLAVEEV
jgi:peptide/nickel transport system permease protein